MPRRSPAPGADGERFARRARGGADADEEDQRVDGLPAALRSLSPEQRALLSLRYSSRLPLNAIGEAMGLPVGTVKSRLHAARDAVRVFMERQDSSGARPSGGLGDGKDER